MSRDAASPPRKQSMEVLRFLMAGLVNSMVGYLAYGAFIFFGMNLFVAQAAGHVVGTTFNYFSHSYFVFKMRPRLVPYLCSSAVNYVLGAAFLSLAAAAVESAYLAGFIALVCTAVCSYLSLKVIAFRRKRNLG